MGNNNLYKIENTLRSIAKRYKSVKYSVGLAILFLMMGVSAFSEDVASQEAVAQQEIMSTEEIASSREKLKNSVGSLQSKIDSARAENEKELKGLRLELVQLMEQGDQIVKSPWSSWQFGANYMYSKWNGTYKGRGDKVEKYPYEGIFTRSTNVFGRTTTARTADQKATLSSIIAANGGFDPNNVGLNYGLISRAQVDEDPVGIEVSAGIRPRNIQKAPVTVKVDVKVPQPPKVAAAPGIPNTPAAPNINIPSFTPVAPQVEAPVIPPPPNILFVVGADCNNNCQSGGRSGVNDQGVSGTSLNTPRLYTKSSFLTANGLVDGRSKQNVGTILHYTWGEYFNSPSFRLPKERASLAFKMWQEEGANFSGTPDKIYFNSYNFAYNGGTEEFNGSIVGSASGTPNKNNQYFFVGGSRFIEMDNTSDTAIIPTGKTVNLGGIYTLAMVSQENNATLQNNGTITDIEENQEQFIINLPNTFSINPPTGSAITMKKSDDGYVGYKVGIVQVQENNNNGANTLINNGTIDFHGEKSLGMYIYLPDNTSNAVLYNKKNIFLSGENNYGMKISAKTSARVEMINETGATITLQQNTTANKKDKADNSVGMALMADETVVNKVNLATGKAVNKGTINLKDNIANSLGMFINIDSNMLNQGTINVSAIAPKDPANKYRPNVGMRANQVESKFSTAATFDTTIVNDKVGATVGKIVLTGQGNIGMLASGTNTTGPNGKGTANAINKGEITIDKGTSSVPANQGKDNFGMLSISEAHVVNEVGGKITIGTAPGSVGMAALKEGTTHSTAENKGIITVNGAKSTGVYNTGHFLMNNTNAKIDVKGNQSIGLYAYETDATHTKTELKQGTVQAANSGVGLYSDKATVHLDNSTGNLKLIANNGGLLFYNYDSGVSGTPVANGKFQLVGSKNITATINKGGYAFYLKNTQILSNGNITGLSTFFNDMFDNANSTAGRKIDITLNPGGTLMILDKPTGGNIQLSSVATSASIAASLGNRIGITSASSKYKVYAVYRGKLQINQNVALDKDDTTASPDAFYKVDFRSSNMVLDAGKTMTGTKGGQVALFQGNYDEGGTTKGKVNEISVVNNGTIKLSGNSVTSGANKSTTTAMAGDFITLTNNKNIEVIGNNGVGIYGAGGSKVLNNTTGTITVGKEGVALYGANRLNASNLGDKSISVINKGTIKGVSGKTGAFGIFAVNNLTLNPNIANAALTNTNTGKIDFSTAPSSIGIHGINSTITNAGSISMGTKGVAINAKNSNITSSGAITLAGKGIGFNLTDALTGRTLNLTSKVTLTGDENAVFNLTNTTFNTTAAGITENINLVSNGKGFTYFSLNNSALVYNKDKTATGKNIVFVNAKNSTVDWRSNLTLNGQNNVAFYLDGVKGNPELKTAAGKTVTLGDNSTGALSKNGARIENNSKMNIGANSIALYSVGTRNAAGTAITTTAGTIRNTGDLTIGKNSLGIYLKDGIPATPVTNTGKITSTQEGAKGIAISNTSATTFTNAGKIQLTGVNTVGLHMEGAAHTLTNNADVQVGNTSGTGRAVAINLANGGSVSTAAGTTIKAGNKSIAIHGTTVATNVAAGAKIEVGDAGIGIYAKGGSVNLSGSTMSIGKTLGTNQEAVGVFLENGGTLNNSLSSFTIGKGSIGIVGAGTRTTTINNNLSSVQLPGDAVYTYTSNINSNVTGNTKITSSGNGNYGYYVAGNLTNNVGADINMASGLGNVGIYSAYASGSGVARNSANITVGKTDAENELYSIAMAAGYTNKDNPSQNRKGHVVNELGATITVGHDRSIGMYASGVGSKAYNNGTIKITGKKAIGMYLENGAYGENNGLIEIDNSAKEAIAVYSTGSGTVFKNYGTIRIKAPSSKGIVTANGGDGGLHKGNIQVLDGSAEAYKKVQATAGQDKPFGDKRIGVQPGGLKPTVVKDSTGKILPPANLDVTSGTNISVKNPNDPAYNRNVTGEHEDLGSISKIGMYIDTSGVNFTNPIQGLQYLSGLKKADLIIGAEAAEYTNAKTITVGTNILARYNKVIQTSGLENWDILSGSLTWAAAPYRMAPNSPEILGVIMTKVDYKEYAKSSDVPYNFLDGLEQRYDMNQLDSKEKRVFNKISGIGKTEPILLSQAFDEMLGQQYANVQQRIQATGDILNKEFNYLRDEWRTASKDSNKIKTFGTNGEYKTDTAGIKDYKYNAYGVAYVHENEDIKLGRGIGWYAGIVHNTFKFKDIGNSKEQMLQTKVGLFKSIPFDDNNSLNWTISGDIFVGHNKMHRKYLVVDEVFNAKSKYYTYGVGIKNEIGKEFRLTEGLSLRPYAALNLEYGRMSKIKEKSGEVRLEVKQNDYFSVRPEVGAEVAFKHHFGMKTLKTSFGVAYENELGRVANAKNKARVGYTSAGWYDLRGEKEDRKGNVKFDLTVGIDNTRIGATANVGYDTKGENLRGGLGLRVIF